MIYAILWMLVGLTIARVVDVIMHDPILISTEIPEDPWYGIRFFLVFWFWPFAICYYVVQFWLECRADRGR